jgi:hypothetical protein
MSKRPTARPPKEPRVVVIHTSGPLAGLREIVGTLTELLAAYEIDKLPPFIDGVAVRSVSGPARVALVHVKNNRVVYRVM